MPALPTRTVNRRSVPCSLRRTYDAVRSAEANADPAVAAFARQVFTRAGRNGRPRRREVVPDVGDAVLVLVPEPARAHPPVPRLPERAHADGGAAGAGEGAHHDLGLAVAVHVGHQRVGVGEGAGAHRHLARHGAVAARPARAARRCRPAPPRPRRPRRSRRPTPSRRCSRRPGTTACSRRSNGRGRTPSTTL